MIRGTTSPSRHWRSRRLPVSSTAGSNPARGSPPLHPVWREVRRHAGWTDVGGAAQRLARREFLTGRRQQGRLGARALTCFHGSRQPLLDEPLSRTRRTHGACGQRQSRAEFRPDSRWTRTALGQLLAGLRQPPAMAVAASPLEAAVETTLDLANRDSIAACLAAARENARQGSRQWNVGKSSIACTSTCARRRPWTPQRKAWTDASSDRSSPDAIGAGRDRGDDAARENYRFIELGRFVERAGATAAMLDLHYREFAGGSWPFHRFSELVEWAGLLKACMLRASSVYGRYRFEPGGRIPRAGCGLPPVAPVRGREDRHLSRRHRRQHRPPARRSRAACRKAAASLDYVDARKS